MRETEKRGKIVDWNSLSNYEYEGEDLGAECKEEKTVFKIWSPLAQEVVLHLYEQGEESPEIERRTLQKGDCGVWETIFNKNLHGIYYDYSVQVDGVIRKTADPYARACGVNGNRSMVLERKRTDPKGWDEDRAPEKQEEDIIYELHVKEFSWDLSGGFSKKVRGKYGAFSEVNTTLWGDGVHPTGISYLQKLGITYVQLMPVYDYGSVDESSEGDSFNWGYDPLNYNVPEGSYASDPFHGEVRIREMKEMIQSLHRSGFRVIMDVVYNHTHRADSWLERTVPGYYYRKKKDGSLSNGSGCGNDLASERRMCGRYILQSVLYWAEEYHIDGFRFDLMGLLDVKLMNRIREELDIRYGRGEKLIYGEPWAADHSPMQRGAFPALRKNIHLLDEQIGMFCDRTRDAIKGHVFKEKIPGFVNGKSRLEEEILRGVTAWCDKETKNPAKAPSQMITYISAHDNLTLWDKLVITLEKDSDFYGRHEAALRANRLAAVICYTSQGRIFLLSGEEFARTKEGIENSYCSSVAINRLDWSRAYEMGELRGYYQGLIGLRKRIPGLCEKSFQAAGRIQCRRIEAPGCVSFLVDNKIEGKLCPWEEVFVIYNSGKKTRDVRLPLGDWGVLVNEERSDFWQREDVEIVKKKVAVRSVSAIVLGRVSGQINEQKERQGA